MVKNFSAIQISTISGCDLNINSCWTQILSDFALLYDYANCVKRDNIETGKHGYAIFITGFILCTQVLMISNFDSISGGFCCKY